MAQDMNGKEVTKGCTVLVPCTVNDVPDDHNHIRIAPKGFKFDSIRGDFVVASDAVQVQPKAQAAGEPGAKATAAAKNRSGPTQEDQEAATQARGPKAQEARGEKVNDVDASQAAAERTRAATTAPAGTVPTTTDDVKGDKPASPANTTKGRAKAKATGKKATPKSKAKK
jgi:hypothetical protein